MTATEVAPPSESPPSDVPPPTAEASASPVSSAGPSRSGRRWLRRGRFGIQSKLLLMLLAKSVLSCAVVGFVGYRSGRDALRESAFERLREVRESRSREITRQFEQLRDSLVIYTRGSTAINAINDFEAGFHELEELPVDPDDEAAVADYYADVFVPELNASTGTTTEPDGFIPTNPAQTYVQAKYTVPAAGDFDAALAVDDAGDGSAWSAAHAEYHDYFRELVERFDFEDALLVDNDGEVVYSAYKGVDLGTNIMDGPYESTVLADALGEAVASNAVDFVGITDFEN